MSRAGAEQEQGRSRARQSRAGQKEGRSWAGAWKEQDRSRGRAGLEHSRSREAAGQ